MRTDLKKIVIAIIKNIGNGFCKGDRLSDISPPVISIAFGSGDFLTAYG